MKTSSKQSRSPRNMSTVFDTLTEIDTEQLISSSMWQNFTDIEKYELPLSPERPSGKVVHAQFEDTNNGDLYLPAAGMTAFGVRTREGFVSWVESFAFGYRHRQGDLREHACIWLDESNKENGPIIEVFIQIVKETDQEPKQDSNKLLTFHLYPTTFVIAVQGNLHSYWEQNEFQYLKWIVDADCSISTAGNPLIHELNLSNDTSYTNFVSAIEAKK